MRKVLAILLVLTSMPAMAAEPDWSANRIMPWCRALVSNREMQDYFNQGLCGGMINGIVYVLSQSAVTGVLPITSRLCVPGEATMGQIQKIVIQYIDQRPQRFHEDFRLLAIEALMAAWSCKR